jgi:hypothetical protein
MFALTTAFVLATVLFGAHIAPAASSADAQQIKPQIFHDAAPNKPQSDELLKIIDDILKKEEEKTKITPPKFDDVIDSLIYQLENAIPERAEKPESVELAEEKPVPPPAPPAPAMPKIQELLDKLDNVGVAETAKTPAVIAEHEKEQKTLATETPKENSAPVIQPEKAVPDAATAESPKTTKEPEQIKTADTKPAPVPKTTAPKAAEQTKTAQQPPAAVAAPAEPAAQKDETSSPRREQAAKRDKKEKPPAPAASETKSPDKETEKTQAKKTASKTSGSEPVSQPSPKTASVEADKSAASQTTSAVAVPPASEQSEIDRLLLRLENAVDGTAQKEIKKEEAPSRAPDRRKRPLSVPSTIMSFPEREAAAPSAEPEKTDKKKEVLKETAETKKLEQQEAPPPAVSPPAAPPAKPAPRPSSLVNPQEPSAQPALDQQKDSPDKSSETKKPDAPAAPTPRQSSLVYPSEQPAAPAADIKSNKTEQSADKKTKVELSGYRYLKYRAYYSSGDSQEFMSREGLRNAGERIEQGTDLTVTASVGEDLKVTGKFYEMPREDRDMTFDIMRGHYGLTYGNVSVSLAGGEFAGVSKNADGIGLTYKDKRTEATTLMSKSKSQTGVVSFMGRNIKGPYDLNARDIVAGSVSVTVNDETSPASDYVLDIFQGTITFNRILSSVDKVTISYEKKLTGGFNAGGLTGIAADRKSANGKFAYGLTHVVQQANRQARKLTESVSLETPALVVEGGNYFLQVQNRFIVRRDATNGTETIIKNNNVTLQPNIDYNWLAQPGIGASDIEKFYAQGRFLLRTPPDPADTFAVSYSYYPENTSIQETIRELLALDETGSRGFPEKFTIYSGSENIYVCSDFNLNVCPILLTPGADYVVQEGLNRIDFTIPRNAPDEFIRADYWSYPDIGSLETDYDHVVNDVRLKYQPNSDISIEYEMATSLADVSSRPITVTNHTVKVIEADLDCRLATNAKDCVFPLGKPDITANTVVLYLNDTVSQESVLKRGSDYTVDSVRGEVAAAIFLPAGTTIIADYQFNPQSPDELSRGYKQRIAGAWKRGGTDFKFSLNSGDTYFTPIGGASDFEVGKLTMSLSQKVGKTMTLSADRLNVNTALDLAETNKRSSAQTRFALAGSLGFVKSFSLGYQTRETTDDHSPAQTDDSDDKLNLTMAMPLPWLKNADMTLGYQTGEYQNNITGAGNTNQSNAIGINYKPTSKLALTTMFIVNKLDSESEALTFSSVNRSRRIGVKWIPSTMLTLTADLDTQQTSDSRPTVADREINSSRLMLSTAPFGKVKSVVISYSQQDTPSATGPSTGSKTTTFTTGYLINKALTFTPAFAFTDSYSGDASSTSSQANNYKLDFRPPGKTYHAALTRNQTTSDVSSANGTNSTENSGWNLALGYDPSKFWTYSANVKLDSTSSGSASDFETFSFSGRAMNKPKEGRARWLNLQHTSRSGSIGDTARILELGSESKLSELISMNFSYKMSQHSSSSREDSDYTGHIIETTLKANF